jgi:hypothetical protein
MRAAMWTLHSPSLDIPATVVVVGDPQLVRGSPNYAGSLDR